MRILHITGSSLVKRSGITGVLTFLPLEQNKIHNVESQVILVDGTFEGTKPNHITCISVDELENNIIVYHPDIIILHDFYTPCYRKVSRIIRKCGIPYFLEPHGAFGQRAMKKSHIKKLLANAFFFRSTIKKASGFIFTTPQEAKSSVYHNKVETIIPNGVQKDTIINSIKCAKKEFDDPVFYFMGRFRIFHKGLDYLFDALDILNKKNKRINIRIYGTSTEQEVAYVESRISTLTNLNVKYCGVVFDKERDDHLNNQCNILVLTSRYEGSPLAVLDAFSYGNPVLVTPGTNVSREVVDNNLGWETPLNPNDIANSLLLAAKDYKMHGKEYVDNTHKYVLDNFTWEKVAEYSINEYKKLLERVENEK